jgi:hypothetical protein
LQKFAIIFARHFSFGKKRLTTKKLSGFLCVLCSLLEDEMPEERSTGNG